jgi:hypothetical protein
MKNRNTVLTVFLALASLTPLVGVSAQTTSEAPAAAPAAPSIKATAELVSHYVWRGSMATGSPAPNIQPTLAYLKGKWEFGVWGSTSFKGDYKEVDPYISFTASSALKFTFTDYDWSFDPAALGYVQKYFNYQSNSTSHRFEGTVGYTGPASFPLSITWNTMFFGLDKKANGDQAYSTYVELGYTTGPAAFFFGFTPWESYYNNYGVTAFDANASKKSFSIVNVGVTLSRSVKITNDYSLPLRATLVVNPSATYSQGDYIHLVFGITF